MRAKTAYLKLLHFLLFFSLFILTDSVFAQTVVYEGFGANAVGGSNSTTVYHVTNLNSSGAGSLANGIGSNKTIVFDVSGTIIGRFDLISISYLTIDANGHDVTINNNNNGDGISFDGANTHHCILKGIRVINAGGDGINAVDGAHDILITNCSSYNNGDGNIDIAGSTAGITKNITLQYCIIGPHVTSGGGVGGTLVTGQNVSVHHNLFAPSGPGEGERCPLVHCNYSPVGNPNADVRNNLIWKFGRSNGTGSGYGTAVCYNATANVINNYYYTAGTSPASATNTDDGYGSGATGQAYMSGNVSGNSGVNPNSPSNHAIFTVAAVTTQDACTAAALVLANAGPAVRSSVEQAIISSVNLPGCSASQNQPPTANAGSDITLTLPVNSTTLLGSGTDADGTIASYAWARVSGPTTFTLGTANAATTTLSNLVAGVYVFRLTVTDNSGATATDNVTVTVNAAANQPPTANAGSDIIITLPTISTILLGSGTDPDGTIVSYAWARVSGPTTFTLGTAGAATTTLINLVAGVYVFKLTVTDNGGATATDNVTVTVNAATNQPPAANAGNNITLTLPTNSTTLVGSGTDADGTIVSYAWTRVSGPTTFILGTANAASTALSNLVAGVYTFRLTVTDNSGATGTDDIIVTVNAASNQPPTANAGNNITLTLPTNSTTLTGSGADPDGTIVSYAWSRVSGPTTFTLGTANAATTTLSNLVAGVYNFRLTVIDNGGTTATDDVTVTVNASAPSNQSPIAIAGNNITLNLPANSTTLNGTNSFDPDGTIISYVWTRVSGPTTFLLANANAATTTLSNLVAGTYIFKLTVTDNNGATDEDNITIIVSTAANQPPVANAGNNIVLTLPLNSTTLNGGNSTDADGTIISYAWARVSGPTTFTLANANAPATGLSGLVQGIYTFRLTITDNDGATAMDDIIVTVNAALNQPPVANAGSDIVVTLPINSTILTGSGFDPDGTIASYAWSRVSGPTTFTLVNINAASTGLNSLVQGVYVFRLTVTDNSGAIATDNVTVTVNAATPPPNQAPVANAGSDITLTLPVNFTILTGSGYDPDGTIASYVWSRVSGPTTFTVVNPNAASSGINGLVQGVYVFRLTVTDNNGATATDVVTVTVNATGPGANQPPTARTENDILLILPVNSTLLHGNTSSDPDGVIVSYIWTQVSGPNQAVITDGLTSVATVSYLTAGIYIFQLKVTDNNGASSIKTIKVTVENQHGQSVYLNIYPNPTSGNLNMEYIANTNGKFRITVYDANRRLMRDEWIDKNQVSISKTIEVSNYGAGVYFIEIIAADNTEKVVKQFVKL